MELKDKFVIVPIDKAANNFAFICKKFYLQVLLREIDFLSGNSTTYKMNDRSCEEIIDMNIEFCSKLGFETKDKEKCLPFMYWIPKMHKNPVGSRYIVASSKCSTKQLSSGVSKAFKLIFNQVNNFHDKSHFYSNFNKFWVVENLSPVLSKIERCNLKKNAKDIATFDFTTLYTKIPHNKLVDTLSKIIDFTFSAGRKKYISILGKSAYWTNNSENSFSKKDLKLDVRYLITECHFTVGNFVFSQTIGIPMGIDPAPFWANLFLSEFESNHMSILMKSNVVSAKRYHGTFRFIDDLCAINNNNEFKNSFHEIYPPELELKIEHEGTHATFLDLDITISNGIFVYKLFDKRDAFPFFIVRMPYLSSNIPSYIFYGAFKSEVLRIAKNTLMYNDFLPPVCNLLQRMVKQGGLLPKLRRSIGNVINNHQDVFQSFDIPYVTMVKDILSSVDHPT